MEQESSNSRMTVVVGLLVLVLVGASVFFMQKQEITDDKFADWTSYETSQGLTFSYPPGYGVTENTDPERSDVMNYFVVGLEHDGTLQQHPPVLQINASSSMVSLALWEGIPWEGYPEILETLEWK